MFLHGVQPTRECKLLHWASLVEYTSFRGLTSVTESDLAIYRHRGNLPVLRQSRPRQEYKTHHVLGV